MSFGRKVLIRLAIAFHAILYSQFNSVNGRQLLIIVWSASFSGISMTMPRLNFVTVKVSLSQKSNLAHLVVSRIIPEDFVEFAGEAI